MELKAYRAYKNANIQFPFEVARFLTLFFVDLQENIPENLARFERFYTGESALGFAGLITSKVLSFPITPIHS